jgi:RNA polymerase sigma-70 factor, ECF subfamily
MREVQAVQNIATAADKEQLRGRFGVTPALRDLPPLRSRGLPVLFSAPRRVGASYPVFVTSPPAPLPHTADCARELEAEFDALVRREYPRLAELAYALLGSRADAEEVVQDVLLGVWRQRARFDFTEPRAYLARAVRNRVISRRRQQATEQRWVLAQPADAVRPPNDSRAERDELLRALDRAVDSLPARSREIFVLQRVNGLSYAEIAETLAISPKTVENLMGRVLQKLRHALRSHLSVSLALLAAGRAFLS